MEKLYLIIASFIATNILSVSCFEESVSVNSTNQGGQENFIRTTLPSDDECGVNETCVRFCCSKESDCLSEEYFNISSIKEAKFLSTPFKVLKGRPKCSGMYVETEPWMFTQVKINKFLKWKILKSS